MPRCPRIHLNNVPLHIVQGGHNREPCLFGEENYQTYLNWLGEVLKREGGVLYAYALMANHVHVLLTPATCADLRAWPLSPLRASCRV
ncbi:MAG: transposase [Betaproteobacteria bacterium]|nr:transposase [Betaproteobacteria bacterium]